MPKGYVYAEIEVIEPLEYEKWRVVALEQVAAHGGRFIVQRGDPFVLAGDRTVTLAMIVEFDSRERAKEWSEALRSEHELRIRAANLHAVLLTGYTGTHGQPFFDLIEDCGTIEEI